MKGFILNSIRYLPEDLLSDDWVLSINNITNI